MVGFAISRLLHRIVWHSVKFTVGALSSGSCPQVNRDFKIEDARRACKPDFVPGRRPGDGHSSKRAIARALLAANPDLWAKAACGDIGNPIKPAQGPYSALLPVGLAMRRLLPAPRWALTPPFHPYRRLCRARGPARRRFVFCGAFRRVTPPGRYPAPLPLGVRTFLAPLQARGHPALRAGLALRLHPRCVNPHLKFKQRPRQQRQHLRQPVAKDGHPRIRPSRVPAVRCQICESAAAPSR